MKPKSGRATALPNTTETLAIGDSIKVSTASTGASLLAITHIGFTAEVNGAEQEPSPAVPGIWRAKQIIGGEPVNTSRRVPAAIGTDSKGRRHAIFWWYYRWVGSNHRIFQHSREWEDADGNELDAATSAIVDEALTPPT